MTTTDSGPGTRAVGSWNRRCKAAAAWSQAGLTASMMPRPFTKAAHPWMACSNSFDPASDPQRGKVSFEGILIKKFHHQPRRLNLKGSPILPAFHPKRWGDWWIGCKGRRGRPIAGGKGYWERLSQDGHLQFPDPGEVRLNAIAGDVVLAGKDLPVAIVTGLHVEKTQPDMLQPPTCHSPAQVGREYQLL